MKNVILYGHPLECEALGPCLRSYASLWVTTQDELLHALMEKCPAAVFVVMGKAAGMEGVIAVRKLYPELPVAWFSGYSGFAPQAYRLNVDYFAVTPVIREKVSIAMKKCGL